MTGYVSTSGLFQQRSTSGKASHLVRSFFRHGLAVDAFFASLLWLRRAARRRFGGHRRAGFFGDRFLSTGNELLAASHRLQSGAVGNRSKRRLFGDRHFSIVEDR